MKKSFIAISTLLVIAAVVLVISITVSMTSISEGQSSLSIVKGEESLYLVEGCMEDVLLKIRSNINYSGGTINRPEGVCTITVLKNGNTYIVTSTSVGLPYIKTIEAVIDRTNKITVTSWKEI